MPMVKLIYFAAEGRGELTRILLNIGAYNACMHGKNATQMCSGHYQLKRLVYSKVLLIEGENKRKIGAPPEWWVRQILDNFWTNVLISSNICLRFVQVLSMSNICENN